MEDDHELVGNMNAQILFMPVKYFKLGKAPGQDNIHNVVPRTGTTTLSFHNLAIHNLISLHRNCMNISNSLLVLKPDNVPLFANSYVPISLISWINKLFKRVIKWTWEVMLPSGNRNSNTSIRQVLGELRSMTTIPKGSSSLFLEKTFVNVSHNRLR